MRQNANFYIFEFKSFLGTSRFRITPQAPAIHTLVEEFTKYGQLSRLEGVEVAFSKEDWTEKPDYQFSI